MVLLLPICRVHADSPRQQAQALEKQGRWFEACCLYDELLSKDRNHSELREAYRRCLRHFRQQRRLEDPMLQSQLARLTAAEAGDLYDQVLGTVSRYYVDRDRLDPTELFHQGIRELRASLEKKPFLQRHLGRVSEADLSAFRATLEQWFEEKAPDRLIARGFVRRIIVAGSHQGLPPGVVALELACGAANSLDEYSLYLAPARLALAQPSDKTKKIVGIGLELALTGQKLEISRVYRKSPAEAVGLLKGYRIVRIAGQEVDPLAPDVAAEKLLGQPGTFVELEVIPRGQMMPLTFTVERQAVAPASVDFERRGDNGDYVGYVQIHTFQESTAQEVREALASLQNYPLRGVVLDLRGNPGGVLKPALDVAELFLSPEAVIIITTSHIPKLNKTWRSRNASPCPLPLVVLVDGETASSAEVLAGALKDNQRALLVGQPTYGKGSIQGVIPLEQVPGGLRLTVAKFTTPSRVPFSGRGIVPTHLIREIEGDPDAALREAERLLRHPMMMDMQ